MGDQHRHRPAVLPPRRQAVAPGDHRRHDPLAPAPAGVRLHLRDVPAARPGAETGTVADGHPGAVPRHPVPLRPAGHGAILHRLHLAGARQRAGSGMQRFRVEPARRIPYPAAGQAAARRRRRDRQRAGRHRQDHPATAGTLHRWPGPAALDRRLGGAQQAGAALCRPGLDPAGGLHRLQRRGDPGPVARSTLAGAARPDRRLLRDPRPGPGADHGAGATPGLQQGRRDHHRLLRFEEEPGHRRAHGQGAVRHQCGGADGVAADAVPPDPADGLRGARATLRQAPRRRSGGAGRGPSR
ncbi:hypothetical protein BANRA_00466 [Pseudomonas aeruginosa]|nr:hypothetical protein BANRA_00466 [Pseudomonas aeruginosa]